MKTHGERYKLILADSSTFARARTAQHLTVEENLSIVAQCENVEEMYHAILGSPGSIVVFAASLNPDLTRLRILLESTGSRAIVLAGSNDEIAAYMEVTLKGFFLHSAGGSTICSVRRVAASEFWLPTQPRQSAPHASQHLPIDRLSDITMHLRSFEAKRAPHEL